MTESRRAWLLPAVAIAAGMLAALLLPVFFGHAAIPLVMLGMLAIAVGLAWLMVARLRHNGVRLFDEPPLAGLDPDDRPAVQRAIRRGEPPAAELAEVILRSARRITARAPLYWLIAGFALSQVINLASLTGEPGWIAIGLAVVMLAVVTAVGLELHHAHRYAERAGAE